MIGQPHNICRKWFCGWSRLSWFMVWWRNDSLLPVTLSLLDMERQHPAALQFTLLAYKDQRADESDHAMWQVSILGAVLRANHCSSSRSFICNNNKSWMVQNYNHRLMLLFAPGALDWPSGPNRLWFQREILILVQHNLSLSACVIHVL